MRTVRAMVVACIAAVVTSACGSGATSSTSTGATTTVEPPASTATTVSGGPVTSAPPATAPPAAGGYAATPVSVPPGGQPGTALLTAVRAAAQSGFDRVVFEFSNQVPGYTVELVDRPILQDGSGGEMAVGGAAVLQVRMAPASSADLSAGGSPTYVGPTRFDPGTPALADVVQVGDFEGNLTWVIGLSKTAAFKASTLDSPPRLVVDVETV